jgi:UDP:flavonoid glycosyltransferase YjiC (YdhE family)
VSGRRIVLTTYGSLGDLHPSLAIALGLRARGHDPAIATSALYRERIESRGVRFHPVRPDLPDPDAAPELMPRIMDLRRGTERIVREQVMPSLRDTYHDLLDATEGADLVVSHPLTYAAPLVAETRGIGWVSTMLAPIGFFSAFDPPVLPNAAFLSRPRLLGPALWRLAFRLGRLSVRGWSEPWRRLRRELALSPAPDPIFEGGHAPGLVLALFSGALATKQADWPPQTVVTGFPFLDPEVETGRLPPALARFLADGPAPIVFTLGSAAVMAAGPFYRHGAEAAARLGRRAVLLVGGDPRNRAKTLPDHAIAVDHAPYATLFPRAAAIVHQGGVGTTAWAMRAGRPMLVVPYAHDQPDNAARVARLGIARTVGRNRFSASRATSELGRLLDEPTYAERAAAVGRRVRREDGVGTACDALEALLGVPRAVAPRGADGRP